MTTFPKLDEDYTTAQMSTASINMPSSLVLTGGCLGIIKELNKKQNQVQGSSGSE